MHFPTVCPEIPVLDLPASLAYYKEKFGFKIDWSDDHLGLAGLSRGETRMFMADAQYRAALGVRGPMVLWLNLDGRDAVDALHAEWVAAGAIIAAPPTAQPSKLYEFYARDPDDNYFRVFYDFSWEGKATSRSGGVA